jgi:hypothetical protein
MANKHIKKIEKYKNKIKKIKNKIKKIKYTENFTPTSTLWRKWEDVPLGLQITLYILASYLGLFALAEYLKE